MAAQTDATSTCKKEFAKGGIRGWTPELQVQRLGEGAVVTPGKAPQIPQALAFAQDSEYGDQQQIPGRDANAPPHPGIRDRLEVADQIEIAAAETLWGTERRQSCRPQPMLAAAASKPVPDFESALL
jgi:hypothetical protein